MSKKAKKQIKLNIYKKPLKIPTYSVVLVFILAMSLFFLTLLPNSHYLKDLIVQTPKTVPINSHLSLSSTSGNLKPHPSASSSSKIATPVNSGQSVRVPILTYHYIGQNPNPQDKLRDNLSVSVEKLDQQLGYLQKNGYNAISLDSLYAALKGGLLPPKPVVLTFDDGYIDFYLNAYPVLKKYGFRVTSFIPTGLINQGYYLTWDQIKEMDASGLVSFQAHSVNHYNLALLSSDALNYQLVESKRVLEEKLGKKVNFMAYPYGISNESTWQAAKQAGYLAAVGSWFGQIESEGTMYDWPREKIGGNFSLEDFYSRL